MLDSRGKLLWTVVAVLLCVFPVGAQTSTGASARASNGAEESPTQLSRTPSTDSLDSSESPSNPAAASRVAFAQQPGNTAAGVAISPPVTVQLKNAWSGNVAQAGVPITLKLSSGSGTLSGTTTRQTNDQGLATFDDVSVDLLGSKRLTASSSGLTSATSKSFEITLGPPSRLVIRQEPSRTATAGVPFPQQPEILVVDAGGNLVTTDNGTHVTAVRLTGFGELQGTVLVTAKKGVVTFANLSHTVAGEISILFTAGSLTSDTSTAVLVNAAAAARLVFLQQPVNTTAGEVIVPPVTARLRDAFGNNVETSGTPVSLELTSGGGSLRGTFTRNTSSGVATFDDLSIDLAGPKQLTASSPGLTSATSESFDITLGFPSRLVIRHEPSETATAGVPFPQQPEILVVDARGNLVTTDNGTEVTAVRLAGFGELQGTVLVTARKGIVTFANLSHTAAGEISILFTSGSLTSDTSTTVLVNAAAAARLVFLQQPVNTTAGALIAPPVTVRLRDAFGNDVETSGTPISLELTSGGGSLDGTLTRNTSSGVATFDDLSIDLAGPEQLTASSGSLTSATSDTFTIAPQEAHALAFVQQPTSTGAASLIAPPVTVQLRDSLGNDVPLAGVSVALQLASGTGTLSGTKTKVTGETGLASFDDLSIDQAGQKQLSAASGSLTPALSLTFTVTAAREARLAFVQQPTNTIAGQSINPAVTIRLRDSLGNDVARAGVSVLVALTPGSSGTLSGATIQLTDATGLASFANLSIELSGVKTLTAIATGLDRAVSTPFIIAHAAPSRLVFTKSPGTSTAGLPFALQPVVALQDQFQNLVTGVAQDVTIAIQTNPGQSGTLNGVTTVRIDTTSGAATFAGLSIDRSGTGYTLTATGSSVSMVPGAVVSSPFTIMAASPSQVRVETDPNGVGTLLGTRSVSSGTSITVYAIARDAFGNFVSNVVATAWSLQNRTGGVAQSDLVPSLDRRSATFTGAAVGSGVITVALTGLTSVPSGTITVVNNVTASKILVETAANGTGSVVQDQSLVSGGLLTVYAIARDLNNNFVSNIAAETWSVVEATGGVTSTDLVPAMDRRSATFTGRLAGTARIRATVASLTPTATGVLTVIAGPPSVMAATAGTPQSAKVGNAFGTRLAATASDAAGNPVGGIVVTFTAPSAGASGSFQAGVNTVVTNTSGVAVAPTFTANSVAGSYTVTATASGAPSVATFELTNSARAVGRLVAVGGTPQTGRVGTAFPMRFVASVQDSFGNPVRGATLTFTAPATGANGTFPGGTLSGAVTTDSGGIGTAPEFTAGPTAGSYTVAVTASGLAGPALFALTNTSGSAASIVASMGSQQATEVNSAFSTGFSTVVNDASGNTVSGVPVTFVAPLDGPSGTFPWGSTINVATDTSGVATAPLFIANTVAGNFAVRAYAQGVATPATFELINVPAAVNAFTIVAAGGGAIATQTVQASFDICVTAHDRFGNIATAFTGTVSISSSGALAQGAGTTAPFESGVLPQHRVTVQNAGRVVLVALRTGGAEIGTSDTIQVNNPIPLVTAILPSRGARGESLDLTVSGSGFLQGVTSVVLGNNITAYETVNSDSQITVALTIASEAVEGPRTVLVVNPPPGGGIVSVDHGFVVEGLVYPSTYSLQTTIVYPTFTQNTDYRGTDYRIVGFPGAAGVPISQFLSGSSQQDWAVYWDNGGSSNYLVPFDGTSTFTLLPGRAFWLLHRGPLVIDATVPTAALDSTTSVRIALHSGWNLINNPFTVPVAWSDIQAANQPEILGGLYRFDGAFIVADILHPFDGCLFDNAGNLPSLVIPFKQAKVFKSGAWDEGSWRVEVELTSGDYTERLAAFGVSPGAENGRDAQDWRRPRGVGALPEVYFEHPEWGADSGPFATDIRKVVGALESWPMHVRSTPRQPVKLLFVGVASVPGHYRVVLVDDDRGRAVDLRTTPEYDFTPTTAVSHIRIAVGAEDAVRELLEDTMPKEFALGNNFPNPFNPSTTIPVTVPWTSTVSLRIYTVLGERVRTLYAGVLAAGRHAFDWDGTSDQGSAVSAGVYLVQLNTEGGHRFVGKMLLIK
jgi:hypothetical protein